MATPINLKFPLRRSSQGAFATNESTIDAVIDDLRMLILTNYGERPAQYDFGANLRPILFEQGSDVAQKINDAIVAAVEKWMPFVVIDDIEIRDSNTDSTIQSNRVHINIRFSVGQLEGALDQQIRV